MFLKSTFCAELWLYSLLKGTSWITETFPALLWPHCSVHPCLVCIAHPFSSRLYTWSTNITKLLHSGHASALLLYTVYLLLPRLTRWVCSRFRQTPAARRRGSRDLKQGTSSPGRGGGGSEPVITSSPYTKHIKRPRVGSKNGSVRPVCWSEAFWKESGTSIFSFLSPFHFLFFYRRSFFFFFYKEQKGFKGK